MSLVGKILTVPSPHERLTYYATVLSEDIRDWFTVLRTSVIAHPSIQGTSWIGVQKDWPVQYAGVRFVKGLGNRKIVDTSRIWWLGPYPRNYFEYIENDSFAFDIEAITQPTNTCDADAQPFPAPEGRDRSEDS